MPGRLLKSVVWIMIPVIMILLAAWSANVVAHELEHADHHDAAMHGSGICSWMCATAGTHVATPLDSAYLFTFLSLLDTRSAQTLPIDLVFRSEARGPPVPTQIQSVRAL